MKCPYCAEVIKDEAIVCRYCGRDLSVFVLIKPLEERISSLEESFEDLVRHSEKQQLPKNSGEQQIADRPASARATSVRASDPSPNWERIGLATLFAALLPVIFLFTVRYAQAWVGHVPLLVDVVLFVVAIGSILGPIPLGGFWVGLSWPGRHLPAYALLGLGSAVLGTTVYSIFSPIAIGPLSAFDSAFDSPFHQSFQALTTSRISAPGRTESLLVSLLGPTLMFVSGALFGDLRERRKRPSREREPGFAERVAEKVSGSSKGPSQATIRLIEIFVPSLIGLAGTIITVLFGG